MGMAQIPNINPNIYITNEDAINALLFSIALEEIGLAHIINSEAEKIQNVVGNQNNIFPRDILTLLRINQSVEKTLRNIIKKEMLLQFKLEDALDIVIVPRCYTDINGPDGTLWFRVEFISLENRTWTYIIKNYNAPFDLSHWSLRINCIENVNIISWEPSEATIDTTENNECPPEDPACGPSGKNFGIKFEYPVKTGETVFFRFTLDQDITLGTTCFLLKFGQETRCGFICGPQC